MTRQPAISAGSGRAESSAERTAGLYPRLLGTAWEDVHPSVRRAHVQSGPVAARGQFDVRTGTSILSRILSRLLKLPREGDALETRLLIIPDEQAERWERSFAGRKLVTTQRGLDDGILAERIGSLELRFRIHAQDGCLVYEQTGAALAIGSLRIPLPRWLTPRVEAHEEPAGQSSRVRLKVTGPLAGFLLSYAGCITVEESGG